MKQFKFEAVVKRVVQDTVTVVMEASDWATANELTEDFLEKFPNEPVDVDVAPVRYRVTCQDILHQDIVSIKEMKRG